METPIHEALAPSHILFLAPQQHSDIMIDIFTENLVNEALNMQLNTDDTICGNIFRIIDSVQKQHLDNDKTCVQLLQLCRSVDEHTARVIRGINKVESELPLRAIKNNQSISEYELTTTYFHPMLSDILSNPKKRVLLR